MASQPSAAQRSSSRWGSFLAGVESRLDTILADEETAKVAARNRQDGGAQEQPGKKDAMAFPSPGTTVRTASANRAQDRLNEKLAKAMANRNLAKKPDASVTTSGIPSRTTSPANAPASPRLSTHLQREPTASEEVKSREDKTTETQPVTNGIVAHEKAKDNASAAAPSIAEPAAEEVKGEADAPRASTDSRGSISTRQSLELTRATTPNVAESPKLNGIVADASTKLPGEYEKAIQQMRSDNEAAELRRQEETHTYLEQIDALQAKLKYLTKEAAEIAKNASADAKPGSLEHKIASKDEQIALLIEEGQSLSQAELKHMSIIKRLRAKGTEDEKVVADSKRAVVKYEKAARDAREKSNHAESAEKRASDRIKFLTRLEKDLETVKADRDSKDSLIQDLQFQLSQATSAAKEAGVKANAEALESERKRVTDLADELSNVKTERDLAEKQRQNELRELREKGERGKERARVAEIERSGEQSILESRLEAYRARVEEASAGQGGDVQAKLLRQIETLQNQYAVASENWQGIEGSLLARVTALEKERDDVTKREADIRRKARETNTRARRMEEELERVNTKSQDMDDELSSRSTKLSTLQERLSKSEADVIASRNDLKAEREAWEVRQAQRFEDERARIRDETARSTPDPLYQHFRTESPATYNRTRTRKSSNADRNNSYNYKQQGLGITDTGPSPKEQLLSQRSSTQPLHSLQTTDFGPHRPRSRHDSLSTVPQVSLNNGAPETPSVADRDEDSFGFHTPATHERTINDLISVSTAGAGPSVQLVERMSAAVRRLESEKAAHKDELSRLSGQRDESREQVMSLMQEVEEKRKWEKRVLELEKEMNGVEDRYLTTLEVLGEKSERVEELKADVQDLKGMYRELIENTMR